MGGRGASSSRAKGIKAITVDYGDGGSTSYRVHKGKITDIDGYNIKNTNGLGLNDIVKRAKESGYKVSTYDSKALKEYDKKRKKEREASSKQLDHLVARGHTSRHGWKGY